MLASIEGTQNQQTLSGMGGPGGFGLRRGCRGAGEKGNLLRDPIRKLRETTA